MSTDIKSSEWNSLVADKKLVALTFGLRGAHTVCG